MELRLYDDYGWQRPSNLGCGRRAQHAGRFIVHAHDMPAAFLELQAPIHRQLEVG